MLLFPSLNTPTYVPLIAAADALANRRWRCPTFERFRVDLNLQLKIVSVLAGDLLSRSQSPRFLPSDELLGNNSSVS